jgi:hypothetical protein
MREHNPRSFRKLNVRHDVAHALDARPDYAASSPSSHRCDSFIAPCAGRSDYPRALTIRQAAVAALSSMTETNSQLEGFLPQ